MSFSSASTGVCPGVVRSANRTTFSFTGAGSRPSSGCPGRPAWGADKEAISSSWRRAHSARLSGVSLLSKGRKEPARARAESRRGRRSLGQASDLHSWQEFDRTREGVTRQLEGVTRRKEGGYATAWLSAHDPRYAVLEAGVAEDLVGDLARAPPVSMEAPYLDRLRRRRLRWPAALAAVETAVAPVPAAFPPLAGPAARETHEVVGDRDPVLPSIGVRALSRAEASADLAVVPPRSRPQCRHATARPFLRRCASVETALHRFEQKRPQPIATFEPVGVNGVPQRSHLRSSGSG